jgi:hypothetical protein
MKVRPKKHILSRCFEKPTVFRFALVVLLAGCAAGAPPPGTSPFALLGDTPYSERDVARLDSLIADLNAQRLAFVVHIGDITSGRGPCSDAWLEARKKQFARIRHPFILLPGDNDWSDCHRGGFDPMERLARWRELFCFPENSFAEGDIRLERQTGDYCEHVRWEHEGMLFVALNVQGSNNNLGRTRAMDAEHERRMAAVFEWLDESIALAESRGARRVVVLMHADPFLTRTPDGFARLRNVLAEHAKWLKGRLVLVHGDSHIYKDDEPLPGLRRVEVFGAPFVSWLRGSSVAGELRVESAGQY